LSPANKHRNSASKSSEDDLPSNSLPLSRESLAELIGQALKDKGQASGDQISTRAADGIVDVKDDLFKSLKNSVEQILQTKLKETLLETFKKEGKDK